MDLKNVTRESRLKTISEIKEHTSITNRKVKSIESKITHLYSENKKRNLSFLEFSKEFMEVLGMGRQVCNVMCEKLGLVIDVKEADFLRRLGKRRFLRRFTLSVILGFTSFHIKFAILQNFYKFNEINKLIVQTSSTELQPQLIQAHQEGIYSGLDVHDESI